MNEMFQKLSIPFDPEDIEWRAGAMNKDKTKTMALAYITSRAVMDRLDYVVGPDNWQDVYTQAPQGGIMCGIGIRIDGEWVWKYDGAENTKIEGVKGGFSDALKRAAVKWGIGRYLYKLEGKWVACDQYGRLQSTPTLPPWALPNSKSGPTQKSVQQVVDKVAELTEPQVGEPEKEPTKFETSVMGTKKNQEPTPRPYTPYMTKKRIESKAAQLTPKHGNVSDAMANRMTGAFAAILRQKRGTPELESSIACVLGYVFDKVTPKELNDVQWDIIMNNWLEAKLAERRWSYNPDSAKELKAIIEQVRSNMDDDGS